MANNPFFLPLELIGLISILAITFSRLIDKPAPGRNLTFALLICALAIAYIEGMAQIDSLQIGIFKLNFIGLMIVASLVGSFVGIVLATIYRNNLLIAFYSGALTGIATFFTGYFIPPSEEFYPGFGYHDLSSLLRLVIPLAVGFVSYALSSAWSDSDDSD